MNKKESLALFRRGRAAWNTWAEERLAERRKLEEAGNWIEDPKPDKQNDATRAWHETATADFSDYKFKGVADFSGFIFPGPALFREAAFSDDAEFIKTAFNGYAMFIKAAFKGDAKFSEAAFSGNAWFIKTAFNGYASFIKAAFSGNAEFSEAAFSGDAWFNEAAFSGDAGFSEVAFSGDAWFIKTAFNGYASFIKAAFSGNAEFSEAAFSGNAGFMKTAFNGHARFIKAAFSGDAGFNGAAFKGDAGFNEAAFKGDAGFNEAAFKGYVGFSEAKFSKTASFVQTNFTGFTSFDHCRFEGYASYRAIQVSRSFSLTQAWFGQVPDFTQARFAESPELYAIHIETRRGWPRSLADFKTLLKGNADLAACWRALKRLAVAAHDHDRELLFWKGEVLARRWSEDKPWHALFYFGLFYGWFSDFGRSVVRPLIGWALGFFGFTCYYLCKHLGDGWLCDVGPGNTFTAALGLSLRNALVLPGSGSATKLDQIYACLYGIHGDPAMTPASPPARFQPVIPDAIAFAGVAQNLWSAVMLFLLFLALRNHFRIK